MTATKLTCGCNGPPLDPVSEGYRQLFAAVVIRAARDALHISDPVITADARWWLAQPEARRLAEVAGLLPEGGER